MASEKSQTVRVKWVRSGIGFPKKQKQVVQGLGFRRLQQVVEKPDTAALRGMIAKVSHLVKVVE